MNEQKEGPVALADAEYLTPVQISEQLQVKEDTVRKMVKRGELKAVRFGRSIRIPKDEFAFYLETHQIGNLANREDVKSALVERTDHLG